MELWALQTIANGAASLGEIERGHPDVGKKLKGFVLTLNRCCRDAYERLSSALDSVLTLPEQPNKAQINSVLQVLKDASNSEWFKKVSNICDDLAALANTYDNELQHIARDLSSESERRNSILYLLAILHRHEGDLKTDIRETVDAIKVDLTKLRVSTAKRRALRIKDEIDQSLTRINGVTLQIAGSSQDGATELLDREQIAEIALRKPERVLIFNMAFVLVLLLGGGTVLQFISILAFPILTGFVLSAVVVLNAFYLRSIDKLRDESFMELMKLALLKFFAPLARGSTPPQRGA